MWQSWPPAYECCCGPLSVGGRRVRKGKPAWSQQSEARREARKQSRHQLKGGVMDIQLGQKVRDKITGFQGIAVCKAIWQYGCIRIGIKPQELIDGKPMEVEFFDEPQVEIVEDTPD